MLTDEELCEKCKIGNPITYEDLGIPKNKNLISKNIRRNSISTNETNENDVLIVLIISCALVWIVGIICAVFIA